MINYKLDRICAVIRSIDVIEGELRREQGVHAATHSNQGLGAINNPGLSLLFEHISDEYRGRVRDIILLAKGESKDMGFGATLDRIRLFESRLPAWDKKSE